MVYKMITNVSKNSYLVGGCIRDFLLKKNVQDIDLVVVDKKEVFQRILNNFGKKYPVVPLNKELETYRVVINPKLTLDLTRTDDIFKDLMKRDFTINSLAVNLVNCFFEPSEEQWKLKINKNKIIDITGYGFFDIDNKLIRYVSKEVFDEDPLRMLRAFRFMACYSFKILPSTRKYISEKRSLINTVSKERIRDEIIKMMNGSNTFESINEMIKTGILFSVFKEFEKQIDCAVVYYGNGGVLKHTLNVIEKMDLFFSDPFKYSKIPIDVFKEISELRYLIKLAGFFHDIAKPHTARIIDGRLRFFGHEGLGAKITEDILQDLRFSNKEIKYITTIIRHHLRIGNMALNDPITQRACLNLFYDLGEALLGLLVLSWADYASHIKTKRFLKLVEETKLGPKPINVKKYSSLRKTIRYIQVVNFMFENYMKWKNESQIKPLIDGNQIMKILNIPPSPIVGKIKKRVINLQLEGKIRTKKQAEEYVKLFKGKI